MATDVDRWMLHFSMPMSAQDVANMEASNVRHVMFPFWVARDNMGTTLDMVPRGYGVTLRIEEDLRYYQDAAGGGMRILAGLRLMRQRANIEAVVIGNEPMKGYDMSFTSSDWGNRSDGPGLPGGKAEAHSLAVKELTRAIRDEFAAPPQIISPGWPCLRLTPTYSAAPGLGTWYRWCGDAYDACDGNGVHVYALNWQSLEDANRVEWEWTNALEYAHKPAWVLESNVFGNLTPGDTRMQACWEMYRNLMLHPDRDRLARFCPFVSNGRPNGTWPPQYLMQNPADYTWLGIRLRGG